MNSVEQVKAQLQLEKYSVNQLYNFLCLGILSRTEYLAELDRRKDTDGNISF